MMGLNRRVAVRVVYTNFSSLGWRGWVGLILGGAIVLAGAIALMVLAFGLALGLIPVVAVGALLARWRLRKAMAEAQAEAERPGTGKTIEIEYSVVDDPAERR